MKYPFILNEFPESEFEYELNILNSKLYKDGVVVTPAKKEKGKPYIIKNDSGEDVRIYLRSQVWGLGFTSKVSDFFLFILRACDPLPKVEVNGNMTLIAEALPWYKCVISLVPALLLAFGGAVGVFIGFTFSFLNFKIMRDGSSPLIQYIKIIFLTGLAIAFYYLAVLVISSLFIFLRS